MNALGLLTKQEAKDLNDFFALPHFDKISELAQVIVDVQQNRAKDASGNHVKITEAIFNQVVNDDVVKFFKNDMSYTVVENKVGQLPTETLLIKISWAI